MSASNDVNHVQMSASNDVNHRMDQIMSSHQRWFSDAMRCLEEKQQRAERATLIQQTWMSDGRSRMIYANACSSCIEMQSCKLSRGSMLNNQLQSRWLQIGSCVDQRHAQWQQGSRSVKLQGRVAMSLKEVAMKSNAEHATISTSFNLKASPR